MRIEVSDKTIEKAIEQGLKQLNTTIDNVTVNVLSEGGLFKKAKIEMILEDSNNISQSNENTSNNYQSTENQAEINAENSNIDVVNTKPSDDLETEMVYDKNLEAKHSKSLNDILVASENISDVKENNPNQKQELLMQTANLAKEWLEGLIYAYNINAQVVVEIRGNDVYAKIDGENLGVLIGYHGEAMEAIQHLTNTYISSKLRGGKRVFVDVSGYREKRVDSLKDLAVRLANRVIENKSSYRLDPMNSFERRIIHEQLSTTSHILTHSEGVEPNRYLIIEYTDK